MEKLPIFQSSVLVKFFPEQTSKIHGNKNRNLITQQLKKIVALKEEERNAIEENFIAPFCEISCLNVPNYFSRK